MIKNYIFDFGKVIVHFDTEYMVKRYVKNADDANLLGDVIFDRLYWDRLDEGTIRDEEVIEESKSASPKGFTARSSGFTIIGYTIFPKLRG